MPADVPAKDLFGWDPSGGHSLGQLGWCEAEFRPVFETAVLEDRGDTELVRDFAGRHVLYFKGRRHGFMPEYVDHPVKDMRTWVEDVKWRLNPTSPERFADIDARMERARAAAAEGRIMCQSLIGGYIPTCDHGVPSNVSYANYLHYRRRCLELGGI